MAYLVYDKGRMIVGNYETQDEATTSADSNLDWFATGDLTDDEHVQAQPGQFYLTDGTVKFELPLTDREKRQADAIATHDQFVAWETALKVVEHYFPPADRHIVYAALAYVHRGTRGVLLSTSWTNEQKTVFLAKSRLGPSGFTLDVNPLVSAGNLYSYIDANRDTITTPTARIVFCNPTTGDRIATDMLVEDSIALERMMVEETTDITEYINGAWTKNIT